MADLMVKLPLKYLVKDVDRHGNVRIYFKRAGQAKVRIRGEFGSEEFMTAYDAALRAVPTALPPRSLNDARQAPAGSLRWLVAQYIDSADFARLGPTTRARRRTMLEGVCKIIGPKSGQPLGWKPASAVAERHIFKWRDEKAATPAAATDLVKAFRGLFKWARERKLVTHNPAKDVGYIRVATNGHHSWTIEEVEQFEARHPVGSKARLALALFLYTSQRISDVALLGLQHRRGDMLTFTQVKNRERKPVTLTIPLIAPLREIIDATPRPANARALTFLLTDYGKAFSVDGLRNKMRQWCDEAGLPHCSSHGLRKAFGARAAELELTSKEIMAIMGHATLEESERYTRGADQKRLAASGMRKIEAAMKQRKGPGRD